MYIVANRFTGIKIVDKIDVSTDVGFVDTLADFYYLMDDIFANNVDETIAFPLSPDNEFIIKLIRYYGISAIDNNGNRVEYSSTTYAD